MGSLPGFPQFPLQQVLCCAARGHIPSHPQALGSLMQDAAAGMEQGTTSCPWHCRML